MPDMVTGNALKVPHTLDEWGENLVDVRVITDRGRFLPCARSSEALRMDARALFAAGETGAAARSIFDGLCGRLMRDLRFASAAFDGGDDDDEVVELRVVAAWGAAKRDATSVGHYSWLTLDEFRPHNVVATCTTDRSGANVVRVHLDAVDMQPLVRCDPTVACVLVLTVPNDHRPVRTPWADGARPCRAFLRRRDRNDRRPLQATLVFPAEPDAQHAIARVQAAERDLSRGP